jgi:hypothetical protein
MNEKENQMRLITLKLTIDELKLLTSLAADQLFRREFIDPKMPGYKSDSVELGTAKALVGRLRILSSPNPPASALLPKVKAVTGAAV